VLAYAGPDVTGDLAWCVRDTLAKAGVDLPDDMLGDLPHDETTPDTERIPFSTRRFALRPDCWRNDAGH